MEKALEELDKIIADVKDRTLVPSAEIIDRLLDLRLVLNPVLVPVPS